MCFFAVANNTVMSAGAQDFEFMDRRMHTHTHTHARH